MRTKVYMALLVTGILAVPFCREARASDGAAEIFAKGELRLADADFDGALDAFAKAAKADLQNTQYRQGYVLLRRVIGLRQQLEQQTDSDAWLKMAKPLQAYYHENRIHTEELKLDQRIHDRFPSPESAARLAETYLELDKPSEAAEVVAALPTEQATPNTTVLTALALARQGELEQARSAAQGLDTEVQAGPGYFRHLAGVRALLDDGDGAAEALARSFEQTPPSKLAAAKSDAKASRDFARLVGTPTFAKAMQTSSKIKESGCSGGAGCGNCPKRRAAMNGGKTPCGKTIEKPPCEHDEE